ncbi:lysozyme [Breoghania corrubedonensis]|uniref:Lysozyme n=1 Tax=Breoghania corrubedonensis TaxID=665038 RepID=A0A2T5V1L1_9HYPH|nr:peptidoglycan-binding protein [Breoghania corrubedonensis]PTW57643.1 lysozyme [Breoghania corrubedonensis]
MRTSDRGRAFIAAHEGIVLRAYRDVAGVWTIGVGHTARAGGLKPAAGMTITTAQAEALLKADLARFEARVARTGAFRAQGPFDGAVSFDFNTGRIHNASWVAHYRAGLFARAETALMRWVKAGGRTWPGLKRRRTAEAALIFRGRYGPATDNAAGSQTGAWEAGGGEQAGSPEPPDVPSRSREREEVCAYQRQLRRLGLYGGALDGLAGAQTRAAVRTFQRAHPHLNEDGIVGPATRAALTRAVNALKEAGHAGGAALVAAGGAAALADTAPVAGGGWSDPLVVVTCVGFVVLMIAGAALVWRYREELRLLAARL